MLRTTITYYLGGTAIPVASLSLSSTTPFSAPHQVSWRFRQPDIRESELDQLETCK